VFYYIAGKIFPEGVLEAGSFTIKNSQMGMLLAAAYAFTTAAASGLLVYGQAKGGKATRALLAISVALSAPFLFQYERANLIILALLFTMLFVRLKDSEKPIVRELSYICLAVAASLKIYPALFGLLLVREKRWKDCLRCVGWGLVLFLFPFLFFEGFTGLFTLLRNILNTSSLFQVNGYGYKVNYANTFSMLLTLVGFPSGALINAWQYVSYFIAILLLVGVFFHRSQWKILALLSLFTLGVPAFSYIYTLLFMVIPLIAFLNEEEKHTRLDRVYLACFIGIFLLIPYAGASPFAYLLGPGYVVYPGAFLHSISVLVMSALLIGEAVVAVVKARHSVAPALKKYIVAGAVFVCAIAVAAVGYAGYKAYQKVNANYLAPLDQLLDANDVDREDVNLIFSRAKWIRLLWGTNGDEKVLNPADWDLARDYLSIKTFFQNGETPFIMDKSSLFSLTDYSVYELHENPYYWDDLFGDYDVVDTDENFILFLPKSYNSTPANDVLFQVQEITGVLNEGEPDENGWLLGQRTVNIQFLNLSGKTQPVTFQVDIQSKPHDEDAGMTVEDDSAGLETDNIWMSMDAEKYDFWTDGAGKLNISQDIILSPGVSTIIIQAENSPFDLSPSASGIHMLLSEPTVVPTREDPARMLASELARFDAKLERSYSILKYPSLLSQKSLWGMEDSYFNGPHDWERVFGNIERFHNRGVVMDSYSVKALTNALADSFWRALSGHSLVLRTGDYFYFEPLGAEPPSINYDFLMIENLLGFAQSEDKESLYGVTQTSYFSIINPFGREIEVDLSFSAKTFLNVGSELYLDINGNRFDLKVYGRKSTEFRETVLLYPGVNQVEIYGSAQRNIDKTSPHFLYQLDTEEYQEKGVLLTPSEQEETEGRQTVLDPGVLDARDKVNMKTMIPIETIEQSFYRIDNIAFNKPS
jgi:hypothetical protein